MLMEIVAVWRRFLTGRNIVHLRLTFAEAEHSASVLIHQGVLTPWYEEYV